jgi:hypothetical protein
MIGEFFRVPTRLACWFRRLAETGFYCMSTGRKVRDGEMPSPTRETHALPNPLNSA